MFFAFVFVFLPMAQTSLVILNCRSNPNGEDSVFTFPHIECGSSSWVALLPFSVVAMLIYTISFIIINMVILYKVVNELANTNGQEQGSWCSPFAEFRSVYINWAVFILLRECVFNAIPLYLQLMDPRKPLWWPFYFLLMDLRHA